MKNQNNAEWSYTKQANEDKDVVVRRQDEERRLGREPRRTIGRDSEIAEGVYEGSYGGEAIVVDVKEKIFLDAYEAVRNEVEKQGRFDNQSILYSVFTYVRKSMQYNSQAVDEIFARTGAKEHQKISLGVYIHNGVGVCRHQALFAGAILEGFTKEGFLQGKVSVDRNMNKRVDTDKYDGHAWVRFTDNDKKGGVSIVDIAQNRIGTLEDIIRQRSKNPDIWNYARPEDRINALGRLATADEGMNLKGSSWLPFDAKFNQERPSYETTSLAYGQTVELGGGQGSNESKKIATIQLPANKELDIMDVRSVTPQKTAEGQFRVEVESGVYIPYDTAMSFVLMGTSEEGSRSYTAVGRNSGTVTIGRGNPSMRKYFGLNSVDISRNHVNIKVNKDNNLEITDISVNGTTIREHIDTVEHELDIALSLTREIAPYERGKELEDCLEGMIKRGEVTNDDQNVRALMEIAATLRSYSEKLDGTGDIIQARHILAQMKRSNNRAVHNNTH